MPRYPLRLAGALLCSLSAAPALAAQAVQLAPVTITGSRTSQDARLPVGNLVIDSKELQAMPANNLADVLDSVGGINTQRFYGINGSRANVDLLGFGATGSQNTLLLLNGRRLNDVDMASVDFSAIPVSAIDHIEIIPGSGSVLYGSGASGGAINIVTKDHYSGLGGFEAFAGSYDTHGAKVHVGAGNDRTDALAAFQSLDSEGYRDNNRVHQRNAFADLRHHNDNGDYYLTALGNTQSLGLPGARTVNPNTGTNQLASDRRGTSTPNDWADQQGFNLMPGAQFNLPANIKLWLDGQARLKKQQYYLDQGYGYTSYTQAQIRSLEFSPRTEGQWNIASLHQDWTVGLDLQRSKFQRDSALNEQTFNRPIHKADVNQHIYAGYVQDRLAVTDDTHVTLGFRHERVDTKANDRYDPSAPQVSCGSPPCDAQASPFDISQDADIWSAGVRHWLHKELSVFANAERNARFATVDEFYERDPQRNFVTSLDPLKPQTGTLYTAGMEWRDGKQHSTLNIWRGYYDNEIFYDPGRYENVNLDGTLHYGVSLNSRWKLDEDLWLTINGSYQRARFRNGPYAGNEVPLVPRATGYARFDWQATSWLTTALAERYVGKKFFDNDSSNTFGKRIPAYHWTDLMVTVKGPEGTFLKLGVYNLEDRKAYDYAVSSTLSPGVYNAYPLPGRYWMLHAGLNL